eukprot:GHRQ01007615.1.p1 GENE.GHRQ01007615.1~~GHRQ01007615.1.p1  ORF type:complete len:215 (+),score=61.10 GHRQ01007615.1:195-839(+)
MLARHLLLLSLLALAACLQPALCLVKEGDVVILSDGDFDRETASGVWMIDIYAPWCSHCQQLEPAWRAFATEMKAHNVKVAKIDGMKNRVLMKRFGVTGFPSLYLLRNGQTWHYTGMRGIADMKAFSLEGYKKATAMPFHKSPNSILGRAIGILHSFPALAKRGYDFLKEEKGFSDMAIIAGVLVIPLTIGAVFICVLDAMYTRQPHLNHQHYE